MKELGAAISGFSQKRLPPLKPPRKYSMTINGQQVDLTSEDVEIISEDIPGRR